MKAFRASMCACLLSLTAACGETRIVTKTEYKPVHMPERFLMDCPVPEWKPGGTYRGVAELAIRRKAALEKCNLQLKAAREFQGNLKDLEGKAVPVSSD